MALVTRVFEAIGLLNKGSATTPGAPDASDMDRVQPVSTNALNVTRVGGVTAVIGGAGAAALAIFSVDPARDATAVVVAAYASVGLIVAAALVTVAIIIAADIRARQAIAVATSKAPAPTEARDGKVLGAVVQRHATPAHADGGSGS
ncbi:MAG TPA: hypothetical protein VFU94_02995 [Conexibacter sp.]|nr:hypothetical protein [Conexibacter sp.]